MIPILILAAGQSRRMGGTDKLMQVVDGQPLLRRQVGRATPLGPVYVALPPHDQQRQTALIGTPAIPLFVPESAEGMGGTLRGAVPHLPAGPFMMTLADLIDIDTNDLQAVLNAMHEHPNHKIWRGATVGGKAGHPIVFAESLRGELPTLQGDAGGERLVKNLKSETYLKVFNDDRARLDLDTPEDWAAWRARQ
jgi:CTP:molybdopterin cytidylyltransferase MocA